MVIVLPHPLPNEVVKGEHFFSCGPPEVTARRTLPSGGHFGAPCPARLSTFGRVGPQACPLSDEEEVRAGEGYRQGTGGVCVLDEFGG